MAEMGTSALPRVPDTARMAEVDRGAAVPTSVPVGASTLWVPAPCQIQYGRVHLVLVIPRRRRSADGRPLLLSARVTPALGTGADPFPETTVPTEWTIFSHAVASTRRGGGQLPPVRASSESSLRRRKPTELVSGFGGRLSRLGSAGHVTVRLMTPRF